MNFSDDKSTADGDIRTLRDKIDVIDSEISALIVKRAEICNEIGKLKKNLGIPVSDKTRESVVIDNALNRCPNPWKSAVSEVFKTLISECGKLQK